LFHVETLTGLGSPHVGTSIYLQLVLSFESLVKVLVFSILTGLIFVRFTKSVARVRFSKVALVTTHRGQRKFMFRIVHERNDPLINVHVDVTLSMLETLPDGTPWRSFYTLPLSRTGVPSFSHPWTVMHIIDKHSKLYNLTAQDFYQGQCWIVASLFATDQIVNSSINTMQTFHASDILFDVEFVDMLELDSRGRKVCDIDNIDRVKQPLTISSA